MRTIHDREHDTRRHMFSQNADEEVKYQIDFSRLMTDRGTSVSSATWSSIQGSVTIQSAALSSNIASATLSMANGGTGLVKVTATQADGNDRIVYIQIKTVDSEYSSTDYR